MVKHDGWWAVVALLAAIGCVALGWVGAAGAASTGAALAVWTLAAAGALGAGLLLLVQHRLARAQLAAMPVAERTDIPPAEAAPAAADARALLLETCSMIEADLTATMRRVTDHNHAVETAIGQVDEAVEGIRQQAVAVAAVAEQANANATGVASATEELSAASREIAGQTKRSRDVVHRAVETASAGAETIGRLRDAATQIGDVAKLISEIAGRTNLLALNATIEAARAGQAGRSFAVVAEEVKRLSVQTRDATNTIGEQIAAVREAVAGAASNMEDVVRAIEEIDMVATTVASAVEQQEAATFEISRIAGEAATGAQQVLARAEAISTGTGATVALSHELSVKAKDTSGAVADLGRRLAIGLRQSAAGDRRTADRIPARIAGRLDLSGRVRPVTTLDLSKDGALVQGEGTGTSQAGEQGTLEIPGIGPLPCQVTTLSELGVHLRFTDVPAGPAAGLAAKLAALETDDAKFIAATRDAAAGIIQALEGALRDGRATMDDLFDADYRPVPGTDPQQYTTRFTALADTLFPRFQEPVLGLDPRVVFCAAVDRRGYLPTHNAKFSQPQRTGDPVWNAGNCRNRRIFDDRAGLAAARNSRPHLIQAYERDMGGGRKMLLKEVDVPILVRGRHWGGLRLAYEF
ncbi:methyl-accepting chemotaxis protein [Azospirillum sp.]|uniref:methyl-accepting chemotaxis protein n=1 Tax=Azospirillum sp. TaxID=34012 RepID=UPI002D4649D9|nr:methyl-accepting chemotaxis protein [Azospirillum sp.]HYD69705.1 methyl-accepting chemotaxis protein [Azospirillum sp.]